MIECMAPGKLYIAGEYAVVEKGYPAILFAVDKFLKISLEKAYDEGSITTYDSQPILWKRENHRLILDKRDNRLAYVMASIKIVETYARELGRDLEFYHFKVYSDLEAENGKKYGLGSSAAVTIATVEALCKYYDIEVSRLDLFKLASLAQLSINAKGSCGDIAVSSFGGIILYKTFDREWVRRKRRENTVKAMLEMDWPCLEIKELPIPKDLKILIGWTGEPASTVRLVDKVDDNKLNKDKVYDEFLKNSKLAVEEMTLGFEKGDMDLIEKNIDITRNLLVNMGKKIDVLIETPSLKLLSDIVKKNGGSGKSSGAGGGDCGIGIFRSSEYTHKVIEEWKDNCILHLPLNIYER